MIRLRARRASPVARIAELNYLADVDAIPVVKHAKFALRYTAYMQFNGACNNYDGFGKTPRTTTASSCSSGS